MASFPEFLEGGSYAVLKFGTNSLSKGSGVASRLNPVIFHAIGEHVAQQRSDGYAFSLVASGAVLAGMEKQGLIERPADMRHLQYLSAIGLEAFAHTWEFVFSSYGIPTLYVPVTSHSFETREERENIAANVAYAHSKRAIPIFNTNDFLVNEELAAHPEVPIGYFDNDPLAARIALYTGADRLAFFTDSGTNGSGGGASKSGAITMATDGGVKTAVFSIDELIG